MMRCAAAAGFVATAMAADSSVTVKCIPATNLELTILTEGSTSFQTKIASAVQTDLVKYLLSSVSVPSVKVAVASFGDKASTDCYHLATPLTSLDASAKFSMPTDVAGEGSRHGHLEGVVNALVDTRMGWSLRADKPEDKLVKAVVLLTESVPKSGHETSGLPAFDLNKLRINNADHCAHSNYPEYADVAHVLKRGNTHLIVGLFNPDEITEGAWTWAVKDNKLGLGSANAHLAVIKSVDDAVTKIASGLSNLITCSQASAMSASIASPRIESQCEADCDCAQSPDCPCCSGFKVLLRLPVEPKDIEVKVTH